MASTVCLVMIVRDCETVIERCLASALPHIASWVVVDTGSVDGTKDVVRRVLADIPGELHESGWVRFDHNRSEALEFAKGSADWLLMLDADMVLHYDGNLQTANLDSKDVWMGRIGESTLDYKLPLLIRGNHHWEYRGVAHSYLASDEPYTEDVLPGLWVEDHSSTGREKLERDLELLSAEHARVPLDARTCFYLARTYDDLDKVPEAIAHYRARTHLDGWPEETFYARYRLGCLLGEHVSFHQGALELLDAWAQRPTRAESLRALGNLCHNVADKIAYPDDVLFVHATAYKPRPVGISADQVSAVVVTRGNVDLTPVLDTLPFDDVIVWDNSQRDDLRIFGRYKATLEAKNDIIFTVDDDVLFTNYDALLAAYEPGVIVANMDPAWAAVYQRETALIGAGALWDKDLPKAAFARYLEAHPPETDDDREFFELECDFIFGTLTPFKIVDVGYDVRPFTDDPDRLYRQPGQTERKFEAIRRAKALRLA